MENTKNKQKVAKANINKIGMIPVTSIGPSVSLKQSNGMQIYVSAYPKFNRIKYFSFGI
jgi:hypothetical protein